MANERESEVLGPIATRVLYEDDHVRIWEQLLQPGESTATHLHENDYVLIDVAGDKVHVEPKVDESGAQKYPEAFDLPIKRGQAYFVEKGSLELATNGGEVAYRAILVELLQAAAD